MEKLTLGKLKELRACSEAVAVYKRRPFEDATEAIRALIDGYEEASDIDEKTRLQWGNWLIARLLPRRDRVRYAVYAAGQVISIFEAEFPDDKRPKTAIEAAKKWLEGEATGRDAADAADAARAAAYAAYAAACAADAAYAAACAARAAACAARAAACAADAADAAEYNSMLAGILEYGIALLKGDQR
jgi:hypothetical protein